MNLPHIECDFNARGWSGTFDDDCYYVFVVPTGATATIQEGLRAFIFMYENEQETEIVGYEAVFERFNDGWRARPDATTWYHGQTLW